MNPAELFEYREEESLTDDQIVNRLREHLEHFDIKHTFTRGQVVAAKAGKSAVIRDGDRPHMFLEYVDPPLTFRDFDGTKMGASASTQIFDCIVICTSGGTVGRFHMDSRELMPHPDYQDGETK